MGQRVGGCILGLVAVLSWEAVSAASRPTVRLESASPQREDPLLALSEGVIGTGTLPVEVQQAHVTVQTAADVTVQTAEPVVATYCTLPPPCNEARKVRTKQDAAPANATRDVACRPGPG
jgi:hypothetical protein